MKISVITACFNSEKHIRDTIESVLGQDFSGLEYIVIDGGSTDRTGDVISEYSGRIDHFVSEKDEGIYDAINKGISMASGDVVGLLHSDDVFESPNVLSLIADQFSGGVDAVYGNLNYVSEDLQKVRRKWVSGRYKYGMFKRGWMPPHPTFFARTELFDRYGKYNKGLSISADYELMLRFIHKHQITLAYIPSVLVKMRVGGESNRSLGNRIEANKQDRLAWKLNGLNPGPLTTVMKPLRKLGQFLGN